MTTHYYKYKRLLWICLLNAIFTLAKGQQAIVAERYTTNDGLSDNSVLCALRDSYGLLWVGTENGLNCFDGLRIHVYRDMVASENPNETSAVMSLYEHNGDIWFGGSAGLYVFNRTTNSFYRFSERTRHGVVISSAVPKIVGTKEGQLVWIPTLGQGLFTYNTATHELIQDSRHGSFFCDIATGSDGLVYAATLSGKLSQFSNDGQFLRDFEVQGYEYDKNPISIVQVKGELWLAYNTVCQRLNTDSKKTEQHLNAPQTGAIHALTANSLGQLFLGTDNGIFRYFPQENTIERLDQAKETDQLTDNMVNDLVWDGDSTLLALTRKGGLNCIILRQPGFKFVPLPNNPHAPSGHDMVNALCRNSQGELWLGTDHGLYRGEYDKRQITLYDYNRLPYEVKALMLDGDDLWIGTRHNGLRILNTKTGNIISHTFSDSRPYTIPSNEVNSIYRTQNGEIYVLTSWGLSRYDRKTENFHGYASINAMTSFVCIQEAASGWLWASSNNQGLFLKRPGDALFSRFQSETIGRQSVTVMYQDKKGDLWAATNGGGLYRYDSRQSDFVRYDREGSVLHGQTISFIEEDDQGSLWMGTSLGIARITPSRDIRDVEIYGKGQIGNSFQIQCSSCVHGFGNVLFGGDGGFYRITTNVLKPNSILQRVYIHELSLPYSSNSQEELKRLGLDILLYTRDGIELPYQDNSFTLHFASSRYSGMSEAKYEYMLEGFDRTWVHGTTTPEATYANLPPGEYEFLLRKVGQTDEAAMARLRITILPPWYRTIFAYLMYVLLVAAAAFYIYYLTQRRLKLRYQRQMAEFQQQQEKETFQSKIRFFIDLVHEIRTPLTLMSLPLEQMEDNKHTTAIRRNMNYLLGITNQLLDFQKQENGGITLVSRQTDLCLMMRQIHDQFSDAVEVQGKHLQLQLPESPVLLSIDKDKMMKVMMNLVGNALKYAKSEIIIRLDKSTSGQSQISIIDDGNGVPIDERDKIFDRYYQIGKDSVASTLGTGLGLAYAKMLAEAHGGDLSYDDAPGGGACFTLTLPAQRVAVAEAEEEADALVNGENLDVPSDSPSLSGTNSQGKFRILLVEDNEELLKATTDALRQWYKVVKAHDGVEALDLLKYNEVDVIVSDVMMPRMDGISLCQRLKQNIETSHLPVILLTAKVSVASKVEGMESGADIYLEKPFSIRQLHLQIEHLLRLRQQFYERMRSIDGFHASDIGNEEQPLGMNQQDLQFVENLQKLVDKNMSDEEFSIDTLAEQLNMSRSSFYRKIKALTGITPTDYLKTARMNQAARLLREGMRSSEVSERVGFTSSSYFAKCFKAQFGCLPKDYIAN